MDSSTVSTVARPLSARHRRSPRRAGFTVVELAVSGAVMVVGLLGFVHVIVVANKTAQANRESNVAIQAAQQIVESMQATPFDQVFATFGGAPGNGFVVPGLDPQAGDADGLVGQILFPSSPGVVPGQFLLREDVQDPRFGTPFDLNGDTVVDGLDHSADYAILPVMVQLQWRGAQGPARLEFRTILGDF
jgi:hypothetical protein